MRSIYEQYKENRIIEISELMQSQYNKKIKCRKGSKFTIKTLLFDLIMNQFEVIKNDSELICSKCNLKYKHKESLFIHYFKKHDIAKCLFCDFLTNNYEKISKHYIYHHCYDHGCLLCDYDYIDYKNKILLHFIMDHLIMQHPIDFYCFEHCKKTFLSNVYSIESKNDRYNHFCEFHPENFSPGYFKVLYNSWNINLNNLCYFCRRLNNS